MSFSSSTSSALSVDSDSYCYCYGYCHGGPSLSPLLTSISPTKRHCFFCAGYHGWWVFVIFPLLPPFYWKLIDWWFGWFCCSKRVQLQPNGQINLSTLFVWCLMTCWCQHTQISTQIVRREIGINSVGVPFSAAVFPWISLDKKIWR